MFRKNLSEKIRALKTDINVRKQELSESLTEAVKVNMILNVVFYARNIVLYGQISTN